MTSVSPSFRVEVSFRAILLCLIFNRVLVLINKFMNPKLPLDGHIYTLTAGRFLKTKVFQINLGELLLKATQRQARLMFVNCSKMDNLDCTKINAHFKNFTTCVREGLIHERKLAPPLPLMSVNNLQLCSTHSHCWNILSTALQHAP